MAALLAQVDVAATALRWSWMWDGGISVLALAAVATAVVVVFGSRGRIEVSPQRQAALATGQADRRTLFEQPLVRPVLWLLLAGGHRLAMPRTKDWLRRQLVAAGSPSYYTAEEYLALAGLTGLAAGAVVLLIEWAAGMQGGLLWVLLAIAAGVGATLYQIHDAAGRRLCEIATRLPYAMDLISLAMGAGATFIEAVRTVARRADRDPLMVELRAMLAEIELGTARRAALENLARRAPIEAMRMLAASVAQAEELGTPLGGVLADQANLLRLARSVRAENAAAVASVRILIPCLLLVIAVILAVFGAPIVRAVRGGLF